MSKDEATRKHLWIAAWSSAASAFNIQTPKDATRWADAALKDFDERFAKEV